MPCTAHASVPSSTLVRVVLLTLPHRAAAGLLRVNRRRVARTPASTRRTSRTLRSHFSAHGCDGGGRAVHGPTCRPDPSLLLTRSAFPDGVCDALRTLLRTSGRGDSVGVCTEPQCTHSVHAQRTGSKLQHRRKATPSSLPQSVRHAQRHTMVRVREGGE